MSDNLRLWQKQNAKLVIFMISGSRLFTNISPSVYNNEELLNYDDTITFLRRFSSITLFGEFDNNRVTAMGIG